MIRITDFKNRRYNLPILYMHDSKVINQIELESIQKDLEGLLIDIQLLCSMANSLTALHEKLFITGRDKFIQEFKINQDESEIISHCLWHPEAILIRRITDNDKNQSTSLITI